MYKNIILLSLLFFFFESTNLFASSLPLKDAEILVKKAVTLIKTDGTKKAFEEINYGNTFTEKEVYVFVLDKEGTFIASGGGLLSQVGKNLIDIKDLSGFSFIKEMTTVKMNRLITYKWPNPYTGKPSTKVTYVERIGEYLVGAGIYKN